MNIPEGWPTREMVDAAWEAFCGNSHYNTPAERITKAIVAALSTAPTPPEVEPIGKIIALRNALNIATVLLNVRDDARLLGANLYTSPPSPKASWDAEGNPLNLEAAARDFCKAYKPSFDHRGMDEYNTLRKFLKDQS